MSQKPKIEMNGDINSTSNALSGNHKPIVDSFVNSSTKILTTKMNGIKMTSFPGTTTRMTNNSVKKEITNVFVKPNDTKNSSQNSVQSVDQTKDQNCIKY